MMKHSGLFRSDGSPAARLRTYGPGRQRNSRPAARVREGDGRDELLDRQVAAGTWWIRPMDGRWRVGLNEEDLGSYHKTEAAIDELVRGHTFRPRNVDPCKEESRTALASGRWCAYRADRAARSGESASVRPRSRPRPSLPVGRPKVEIQRECTGADDTEHETIEGTGTILVPTQAHKWPSGNLSVRYSARHVSSFGPFVRCSKGCCEPETNGALLLKPLLKGRVMGKKAPSSVVRIVGEGTPEIRP